MRCPWTETSLYNLGRQGVLYSGQNQDILLRDSVIKRRPRSKDLGSGPSTPTAVLSNYLIYLATVHRHQRH